MQEDQFKLDLDFRESAEKKLYNWLNRNALGLVNAKKAGEIEDALGFSQRQIAEIKSNAVITYHLCIGSTTTDGYFIPVSEPEREIGGRELKAKAIRILVQYAAYSRITEAEAAREIAEDLFKGGKDA